MNSRLLLVLVFLFFVLKLSAQEKNNAFKIGFNFGFGSEFNDRNYTFTNHFYKMQLYYTLKEKKNFQYEILVQPEVNFGKHQLLNFYFVQPFEPDYLEKRERFTQLKNVHEYVLNLGFLIRKPLSKSFSFYVLGKCWPYDYGY
jgi:hypothetical protein